jgi:hypothetical protein
MLLIRGRRRGTYNVVTLDPVDFAPCIHYPPVVGGNHSDDINALALELVNLLNVGWEMEGLAAGREGTCSNIINC